MDREVSIVYAIQVHNPCVALPSIGFSFDPFNFHKFVIVKVLAVSCVKSCSFCR